MGAYRWPTAAVSHISSVIHFLTLKPTNMVLIGRITKDAVIKKLKDERQVVNFSIAINDYYKPKGAAEGVTITTYYNCS